MTYGEATGGRAQVAGLLLPRMKSTREIPFILLSKWERGVLCSEPPWLLWMCFGLNRVMTALALGLGNHGIPWVVFQGPAIYFPSLDPDR